MIAIEADVVIRPDVTERLFKNFDAALDFCRLVQPKQLSITTRWVTDGVNEVGRKEIVLQYVGSEGML